METDQTQVVSVFDADRTQVSLPLGAEVTQAAIRIECPVCRTSNPPGERWCQDCGFLLSGTPGEEPAEQPSAEMLPRLVPAGNGGREFILRAGANSVGRENADVLLLDATVSRRHATITLEDSSVTVIDHGSTNGTRVAGQPVAPNEPRPLYDGDEVRFGSATFTFTLPGAPPRPVEEAAQAAAVPASPDERAVRAKLIAADGSELALREGANTIGRRSENDVVVRGDPYVSGRHAEIHCEPEGTFLVDAGSTNGTFLHGERLQAGERHALEPGDEVRFGQSVFRFETVEVEAEAAEPTDQTDQSDADATADQDSRE